MPSPRNAERARARRTRSHNLLQLTATLNASEREGLKMRLLGKIQLVQVEGVSDPCWMFTGTVNEAGYGLISVKDVPRSAHVVAFELYVGEVPSDPSTRTGRAELDHLCAHHAGTPEQRKAARRCCNPNHLHPVSHKENAATAFKPNAVKTHCPSGHAYDHRNTYVQQKPTGSQRVCRACARDARRLKQESRVLGLFRAEAAGEGDSQ